MTDCKSAPTSIKAGIVLEKAESEYQTIQKFKMNYQLMLELIMYIML